MKKCTDSPDRANTDGKHRYTGQELSPYDGRTGSLSHLDLPSRMGDVLFYRSRESVKFDRACPVLEN